MTNAELAAQLVRQADDRMAERKAALCAAVALSTTSSVAGAKRALAEWNGPEPVKRAGIALIDQIASEE